jgi:hypothetical protein
MGAIIIFQRPKDIVDCMEEDAPYSVQPRFVTLGTGDEVINKDDNICQVAALLCPSMGSNTLSKSTNCTTKAGTFKIDHKVKCQFILHEFHEGKDISWNMYVDESDARLNSYDMITGRDLLHELGINLLFSLGVMKWDNATVPMRDPSQLRDSNIDDFEDA